MSLKVFISSTGRDLADYRAAAIEVCLQFDLLPIAMEFFEAMPLKGIIEASFKKLDDADLYVGIFGFRYGYIPGGYDKSVTELEYDYAGERGIPRLCFFADPKFPWPKDILSNDYEKTERFRRKVEDNLIRALFTSVDDFKMQLASALASFRERAIKETEKESQLSPYDPLEIEKIIVRAISIYDNQKAASLERVQKYENERALKVKPIFGMPSHETQFKCDIFMIMPFKEEFTPVYKDVIVPLVESLPLTIKRGDNFFSKHAIVNEIWSAIYYCRLVLADCTGKNANVFYELGLAHALGKPVIMITQNKEDIPFDLQHLRHIVYENSIKGVKPFSDALREAIVAILNNPDEES